MEKFNFEGLGGVNGNKREISKKETLENELDKEELKEILKSEDVPYLAEKYLDDPLKEDMNKIRHSRGKKNVVGGQLKGKAKKKDKPIIGLTTRKNK